MNWYKTSQSLEQALLPTGFNGSAFPETESTIEKLGMSDLLSQFADEKNYEDEIDYLLCALYPQFEQACRHYYKEGGKKLVEIVGKDKLKEMDRILAHAVLVMFKMQKSQERQEKHNELV